ncbi:tRNA lysidine(34) synthetase TilS [Syntrophomonas curvata]
MLAEVQKYIKEHSLINPGELIIVGVSGGPDSMALLHILASLRPGLGFDLAAAHLNHGLRPEAAAEENFVREYCASRGIAFYSCRLDIGQLARREKKSLEEAGRESRYRYFAELADKLGASRIATAHHQDDNAETVLLNLVRGSGIKGLRGIRPLNGMIIRPLLCLTRSDIENYLDINSIEYCIDQSNYSTDYLRNRIRHQLLPLLKQDYNPRIMESLNQLAAIAAAENEAMELETDRWGRDLIKRNAADEIILDTGGLGQLHPAYQRRIIRKVLFALQGERGWDFKDIELVRDLLTKSGSSKSLQLKKGLYVKKIYRQLVFGSQPPDQVSFSYKIKVPGQLYIPEIDKAFGFYLLAREDFCPAAGDFYLDYDKIEGELYLRSRRPGDWFYPWGMQGRKKIKDFFIDLKVPREEREQVPLLATAGTVYGIWGFRISRLAVVDADTDRVLLIKTLPGDKNKDKSSGLKKAGYN